MGGAALLPGVAGASTLPAIPSDPAYRYFVKVGDIVGDVVDGKHKSAIEALAWHWGVTSSSSPVGAGGSATKSSPSDFVCWARSGIASPDLWLAVAEGRKFLKAQLDVVHSTAEIPFTPVTLVLNQLYVTSYQVEVGDDGTPIDVVRMDYARATYTARQQRPDGSVGTTITRGFDFVNNIAT